MFLYQKSLFEVGVMKFWFPTIAMDRKSHQLRGPPACNVEKEFFVCDEKSVLNLKGHDWWQTHNHSRFQLEWNNCLMFVT